MTQRRIAVIGSNGQLGTDICLAFAGAGWDVSALTHADLDVTREDNVAAAIAGLKPNLIVNTAAMHDVERCEAEPSLAYAVNESGARNVARAAASSGAKVMHISTDYVFSGEKASPYVESDRVGPLNAYGASKVAGEAAVVADCKRAFVVRVSALYGASPCRAKNGLNFPRLMLKLAKERGRVRVVTDEMVSPTYTEDVAQQMIVLADSELYGVVHATSGGECSWFDFARAVFEETGTTVDLQAAAPGEFPAKVPRPKYSVLENSRLQSAGIDRMPHWRDAIGRYLKKLAA